MHPAPHRHRFGKEGVSPWNRGGHLHWPQVFNNSGTDVLQPHYQQVFGAFFCILKCWVAIELQDKAQCRAMRDMEFLDDAKMHDVS